MTGKLEQLTGTDLEKKVKQATSPDPTEHATSILKNEIADATHDYTGFREVMNLLWKRLLDSGKNWVVVTKVRWKFLVARR